MDTHKNHPLMCVKKNQDLDQIKSFKYIRSSQIFWKSGKKNDHTDVAQMRSGAYLTPKVRLVVYMDPDGNAFWSDIFFQLQRIVLKYSVWWV